MSYLLYTSGPIDYYEGFTHINMIHKKIIEYIQKNPTCGFTYQEVWREILNKLAWAWIKCDKIDKNLRSNDVYIFSTFDYESFEIAVLFKSDNNGTMNLIMDDNFCNADQEEVNKKVYHEFGSDWVEMKE